MTLALLDTCTYLRLAKRIKPLLGVEFGQKPYVLTVLQDVENEVHRNPELKFKFPWFDDPVFSTERVAKRVRLSRKESQEIKAVTSILRAHVLEHVALFTSGGRSPPSCIDCFCLAFGQIRSAIVVTDDIGMHDLAAEFEIPILHGHDILKKMLTAKVVSNALVSEIFHALEENNDLPSTWRAVKHTAFKKIFGPSRSQ